MNKKIYMKPSMMVVQIQAAKQILGVSNVGVHNEVSGNRSYAREYSGGFDDDTDFDD